MALDEPKDSDTTYDINGITYLVDKGFMEQAQPIKIDFQEIGFKITSNIDLGEGCSSCGTNGTCG